MQDAKEVEAIISIEICTGWQLDLADRDIMGTPIVL
jgi:hypothetical protein